jgi:hypothetical protein
MRLIFSAAQDTNSISWNWGSSSLAFLDNLGRFTVLQCERPELRPVVLIQHRMDQRSWLSACAQFALWARTGLVCVDSVLLGSSSCSKSALPMHQAFQARRPSSDEVHRIHGMGTTRPADYSNIFGLHVTYEFRMTSCTRRGHQSD